MENDKEKKTGKRLRENGSQTDEHYEHVEGSSGEMMSARDVQEMNIKLDTVRT